MATPNTISFGGTIYTVAEDGVTLDPGVVSIAPGSAAVSMSVIGNADLYIATGAISNQSNVHGAFAHELDYGISLNDTIGSGVPEAGYLFVYGSALYTNLVSGQIFGESGSTVYEATIGRDAGLKEFFGSTATLVIVNGISDVYGVDNKAIINFRENVGSGGITNAGTVNSKGILRGLAGSTINNALANQGGVITLQSGADLNDVTLNGGVLIADFGSTITNIISFTAAGGTAALAGANPIIVGFGYGDTLNLSGSDIPTESFAVNSDNFTFNFGGGNIETFTGIAGNTLDVSLTSSGDAVTDILCFTEGTHIRTRTGEDVVEKLKIGDMVTTRDGKQAEIKFIGRRSYDGRFLAGNHLALPITITKNAIADNIPARDLTVSPGHGIYIEGVIVPAWRLVNGKSVTHAAAVTSVDYFHIELADGHDILLAENCPVESYLDIGNRNQFHNAAEYVTRYPVGYVAPLSCAPRVESGFLLEAIQNRVAERAGIATQERKEGELRGFVDQAGDGGVVSGWAQDIMQPEMPVILDILVDGHRLARVLANQYRADLRAAALGSGCHAFEFAVPPGVTGKIVVQAVNGAILPMTEAATNHPQSTGTQRRMGGA